MTSNLEPRRPPASRSTAFHVAASILLLATATTLDSMRPFGRHYSILYLIPVFYASWSLRGWREIGVYTLILLTAYLRNLFGTERVFTFNRVTGTLVAFAFIGFMWDRRRHMNAMQEVNRDLEERVRVRTQKLTELNEEFKRLVDVRTQFLRNMSHEIRTPLNAIVGIASLLRDAKSESERRELIDTLDSSTQLTLAIVNDILDLSQLEAGRMEIDQTPFSMQATVGEVAQLVEPEARRKGLTLVDDSASCLLPPVLGDQRRVRQILLNVAGNAVKFTERGFVQLQLEVLEQGTERCRVKISVRDSGIGIASEAQSLLFEKFTQADASIGRRFGGSGLGLAITKGLVDLMQGEIGVESEEGNGASFWVVLPFALSSAPTAGGVPSRAVEAVAAQRLRVLVVEDNAVNRRLVERFLDRLGCAARFSDSGEEGLAELERAEFDVVFMDCHMPGMDGYETTKAIRRLEAGGGRRTPVIAMTASVLVEDRESCFRAGMDDFLAKPFSLEEFRAMLERWTANGGVSAS